MEWWEWLVIGGLLLVVLALLGLRAFRATRRGRRFMALSARARLRFGRLLFEDREVPWPAKAVLGVLVAYLAMPFDLVPDFIPVVGQLDDALVVALAVGLLLLAVPRERFDAALDAAEAGQRAREAAGAARVGGAVSDVPPPSPGAQGAAKGSNPPRRRPE